MHRLHSAFTAAVPVSPGCTPALQAALRKWQQDQAKGRAIFDSSETVLFVSAVVLKEAAYEKETLPATLVFATTYVGPLSTHLDELLTSNLEFLSDIFQHCIGFPGSASSGALKKFLGSHAHSSTFFSRYQCFTKQEIAREKTLQAEIQQYIKDAQEQGAFEGRSCIQIRELIQQHIRLQGNTFQWAFQPAQPLSLFEKLVINAYSFYVNGFVFVLMASMAALLFIYRHDLRPLLPLGILVLLGAAIYGWVFIITRARTKVADRICDNEMRKIAASQLRPVLNEMTAAAPLKRGLLRRLFFASALWFIRTIRLPIDVPTVSCIRWLLIDKHRRLVFFSNFSNTTDFYVRDFLNGKSTRQGINFMFTNGEGFPDTTSIYSGGIGGDPEGYMNAVHKGQVVTDFYYAHEPMLTQDIIHKYRLIRNGLFTGMNEDDAKRWLRLL